MFPFNRIGGLRGEEGGTIDAVIALLSQLVTAIEDLTAAVNLGNNQQAEVLSSIGVPGDTDCDNTLLASICAILGILGGEGSSVGAPPATCPGFPANPVSWSYGDTWYLPETELTGPTGNAAPNWTQVGGFTTVTLEEFFPLPGDEVYRLSRFLTDTDGTNLCFSWDKREAGWAFNLTGFDVATDAVNFSTSFPLQSDVGIGSHDITFDSDEYLVLQAQIAGGEFTTPPDATIWAVQGPFG